MSNSFDWNTAAPPLSFTYGDQSSAALLPTWEREESQQATSEGTVRQCRFTDPATALCVTAHIRRFRDFPATEWLLDIANQGTEATPIIEALMPLDVSWQRSATHDIVLHHAHGSTCALDDFLPIATELNPGQSMTLSPNGGRSSDGTLPFMNVQWPGGGCVIAVGWSGQWSSTWERGADTLRLQVGMEHTHLRLLPGEQIRTPRVLLLNWDGDDPIHGNNLLRRLLLAHYSRRVDGDMVLPPIAHMTMSTFHRTGFTDEAGELDALARAAALGIEAFWVDACWYGAGGKWFEEVGTWSVRSDSFPRGLRPISDAAHAAGMKFVLWVEPERVRKGTAIEREHPEFLLRSEENPDNALFNLGLPEARTWLTELLSGIIQDAGVDIYRQDFNMQCLPYWRAADTPDREGMSEIRHVEGLYAVWDELLRRYPHIAIDNCASGGRRIDLETTARSFPLWRSDFSDVGGPEHGHLLQIGDQVQTAGLSRWVPLHSAAVWSFTPYAFRSAMSTGVVLYCDIRENNFPTADAQRAIAELKRLRPYFLGDFYPLLPLTTSSDDWCAYQFDRPDVGDGCAVFLRRQGSAVERVQVALQGINGEADYEVGMTETFDEPTLMHMRGSRLAELAITITSDPGSQLLQYRKVVRT